MYSQQFCNHLKYPFTSCSLLFVQGAHSDVNKRSYEIIYWKCILYLCARTLSIFLCLDVQVIIQTVIQSDHRVYCCCGRVGCVWATPIWVPSLSKSGGLTSSLLAQMGFPNPDATHRSNFDAANIASDAGADGVLILETHERVGLLFYRAAGRGSSP